MIITILTVTSDNGNILKITEYNEFIRPFITIGTIVLISSIIGLIIGIIIYISTKIEKKGLINNKSSKYRKNKWNLPYRSYFLILFGVIIEISVLLNPVVSISSYYLWNGSFYFLWIWGLEHYDEGWAQQNSGPFYGETRIGFIENKSLLIYSRICTFIIIICIIIIINSTVLHIKKWKQGIQSKPFWLIPSLLIIICTISWAVIIDKSSERIHGILFGTPFTGVFGMFIGFLLSTGGYLRIKSDMKRKMIKKRKKGENSKSFEEIFDDEINEIEQERRKRIE